FVLDGPVRRLLDRRAPLLECLLQRMRRRHPVRELELDGLVLRERSGCSRQDGDPGRRGEQCCQMMLGPMRWHRFLRAVKTGPPGKGWPHSALTCGRCKVSFA